MAQDLEQVDWSSRPLGRDDFIACVFEQGREHYRELPWRNIDDAYGVLVSEVMLQQTQVARVLRYWDRWMTLFPTVDALAAADTSLVLECWQGLGYNRRALALKRACEKCASQHGGALPSTYEELIALPGIGPATAAGILSFAYQVPSDYLETNVRSVFLHELFPDEEGISDKQLLPYVHDACPTEDARSWYYALLDYGSYLKSQGMNPSRRSKHYARQSSFSGSHREKRSFLLKQVLAAPDGIAVLDLAKALNEFEIDHKRTPIEIEDVQALVDELIEEGFFKSESGMIYPA